jgi:hypothetical protein
MYLNRFARITFWGASVIIVRESRSSSPAHFHELTNASRQRIARIILNTLDNEQMIHIEMDLGESES